jgi:ribose-phosphate pyrophosphokinase
MISVNMQAVDIRHFPDKTQLLNISRFAFDNCMSFKWYYENDEELVTLMFLVKHFDDVCPGRDKVLEMPFVPNARFDRTKSSEEVFTLKYFCDIINSLNFKQVIILDPHSNVAPALLDRVVVKSPRSIIFDVVENLGLTEKDYVYFPDEGACKRYSSLLCEYNIPFVHGEKKRDWSSGKIEGLDIVTNGVDLTGKTVIMIDDIISYGGTFYYSAKELKKAGVGKIYAFVTHTENSVFSKNGTFKKCLEDGTVECLCTTDSLIDVDAIPDKYKDKVIII